MKHKLIPSLDSSSNNELIVFFNGWAHDENVLNSINLDDSDVLLVWDYREINLNLDNFFSKVFSEYENINLIAWSLGVVVANQIFKDYDFNNAIAINGTIKAIDAKMGIPLEIYQGTLDGLNEISLKKFNRRMCFDRETMKYYQNCQSTRNIQDIKEELGVLKTITLDPHNVEHNIFNKAYISKNDAIFPFENLLSFWSNANNKIQVIELEAAHFCFNKFNSLKEIIAHV